MTLLEAVLTVFGAYLAIGLLASAAFVAWHSRGDVRRTGPSEEVVGIGSALVVLWPVFGLFGAMLVFVRAIHWLVAKESN